MIVTNVTFFFIKKNYTYNFKYNDADLQPVFGTWRWEMYQLPKRRYVLMMILITIHYCDKLLLIQWGRTKHSDYQCKTQRNWIH